MRRSLLCVSLVIALAGCDGGAPLPPVPVPPSAPPATSEPTLLPGVLPTPIDPRAIPALAAVTAPPSPRPSAGTQAVSRRLTDAERSAARAPLSLPAETGHGQQGFLNSYAPGPGGLFVAVTAYADQAVPDGGQFMFSGTSKGPGCVEFPSPQVASGQPPVLHAYNFCDGVWYGTGVSIPIDARFVARYVRDVGNALPQFVAENFYAPGLGSWSMLFNQETRDWDLVYRYGDSDAGGYATWGWSIQEYWWTKAPCSFGKYPIEVANMQQYTETSGSGVWATPSLSDTTSSVTSLDACTDHTTLTVPSDGEASMWSVSP